MRLSNVKWFSVCFCAPPPPAFGPIWTISMVCLIGDSWWSVWLPPVTRLDVMDGMADTLPILCGKMHLNRTRNLMRKIGWYLNEFFKFFYLFLVYISYIIFHILCNDFTYNIVVNSISKFSTAVTKLFDWD